jgi:hypothetical protein
MAFRKGETVTATLSGAPGAAPVTKQVSVMTVGASSVDIFVGTGGPTAASPGATGLSITGAKFGLALLKPTVPAGQSASTDKSSYYALRAHADSVSLVGIDPTVFALSLGGIDVAVNGGTDSQVAGRVVDFTKFDLDGVPGPDGHLSVQTGNSSPPIDLDFSGRRIEASAADALLSVGGFVQIRGGLAFTKSAAVVATLSDGSTKSMDVSTFGFRNVNAFVGAGPYYTTTGSGSTFAATTNPDAAGLLLSGGNLAVALVAALAVAFVSVGV